MQKIIALYHIELNGFWLEVIADSLPEAKMKVEAYVAATHLLQERPTGVRPIILPSKNSKGDPVIIVVPEVKE
jgi:hypothetical protein